MTAQSFQCPACGAPLIPRGNVSVISCPHCHTSVIVPEELRQDSEAAQWTTLLFDNFSSNDNNWSVGNRSSEYFAKLNQTIADGRYRWEAEAGRPNSILPAWLMGYQVSDFHLTVNCKHISGSKAGSGWGMIFRIQDNQNYYSFRMTDQKFLRFRCKRRVNGRTSWIGREQMRSNRMESISWKSWHGERTSPLRSTDRS